MIRRAKTHTLSSQVIGAGKDTKKLFRLIDAMTGKNKSNPLPHLVMQMIWLRSLPLSS